MWEQIFYFMWYLLGSAKQDCGGVSYGSQITGPVLRWPWGLAEFEAAYEVYELEPSLRTRMMILCQYTFLSPAQPLYVPGEHLYSSSWLLCLFLPVGKPSGHEESPHEEREQLSSSVLSEQCKVSDFQETSDMLSNANPWHPAMSCVGWEIIINNRLSFNFRERERKLVGVEVGLDQQQKLPVTYYLQFYISCHSL